MRFPCYVLNMRLNMWSFVVAQTGILALPEMFHQVVLL